TSVVCFFFYKHKTAYDMIWSLEFRRVLFRSVRDHAIEVEQQGFDHTASSIIARGSVRFVEQFHRVTHSGREPAGSEAGPELHHEIGRASCRERGELCGGRREMGGKGGNAMEV